MADIQEAIALAMEAEQAGGYKTCHVKIPAYTIDSPEEIFETDKVVEYADAQRIAKALEETLQTLMGQIARMSGKKEDVQ
jgi:hypothetical protein